MAKREKFERTVEGSPSCDWRRPESHRNYGISTNRATKPVMLAEWRKAAQENQLQVSKPILEEACSLTRDDHSEE